ncbi:MAG: hypothetical protein IJ679_09930 [Lachnospiraceae bacterium]|nr:hypothetical protein [Lachnospiraceae bacterium]
MSSVDLKYIASLVDDARLQDSNAFASLFAITYEEQYKLAYSYLWDKSLVQDTLLDIYLNALHSLRRLTRSKDFIKWMNEMNVEACEILAEARDIEPPAGRPKIPPFPLADAERLLEYIFMEEGRRPNSIPLATLIEYNEYRMQRYTLQKYLILTVVLCFATAPVFLINPTIHLDIDKVATNLGLLTYRFTVDTFIPVDTATATIDGKEVPVLQDGKRSYYILPTSNGKLEVQVNFANRRTATDTASVSGIDRDVPKIVSNRVENGKIFLYLKDDGSGVFWKKIYAINSGGSRIQPDSFNGIIGEVIFDFSDPYLNVYIPDRSGNVLHAVINHK